MSRCFHIASRVESLTYRERGALTPASLESEGFIHCSFSDQLEFVLEAFFAGRDDLVLLEFDPEEIEALVVEPVAEAGDSFPHVYAAIPWEKVHASYELAPILRAKVELPPEIVTDTRRARERRAKLEAAFAWTSHAEGMRFAETERNGERTCGHFWFVRGAKSVFHRVTNGDELWLIHEGSLRLHVIDRGELETITLGTDVGKGERPVVSVPCGALQAAELVPGSDYAFGSNVCAPPFVYEALGIPSRAELIAEFPEHTGLLTRLTHG